jgi:acyl-CoA synthetase (AMP-forming)/AMP-acid ligase II
LREDGSECGPDEPGELVHRGALVAMGYWRAPELTAKRFRPVPGRLGPGGQPEIAVWSGDTVIRDAEGFLFFRGRRDEMLKTSGYRVSPEEVEQQVMQCGLVREVAAVGIPDERLGQAIVLVVAFTAAGDRTPALLDYCRAQMPNYMVPRHVVVRDPLPRNANGKFDRVTLAGEIRQQLGGGAT